MLYKNAKIFVGKGKTGFLENGFIYFENGIIKDVGEMKNCKKEYSKKGEKDFLGFKIYPGFIDSHTHLGMWETGVGFEGDDGNEETDPITSNFRAIDAINPKDEAFFCALKKGITTVISGPGSSNPIAGSFVALKTFGECVDDMIIKNPVGMKFALGENPKRAYNDKDMMPMTRMGIAALIREQLEKAKAYEKKLKTKKQDLEYDAKLEALVAVLQKKVKALFHCHRMDDIFTAIRISKEFNLDFVLIHATEAHLTNKNLEGINLVLGPIISDISKIELKNFSEKAAFILNGKKANISICTDAPVLPVQYLNISCAVAIKNGLSEKEAVFAITKNPAKAFKINHLVGEIQVKKLANFAIFKSEEDIFSLYTEPCFVVLDGEIVFKL